ncbi:alkaline phosphatase family protein [Desulforamulus hydrothermalis]|uniref:Type I phosphodiesterase/nucleotide pyrophosphatase n=1 Tax=Desulforamulus hydrothermalis Lam5 = DSM 18033 TaxID=1121428 RepID=K8DX07_9FIRM|nr:alkaline phosphatase family protein [Desulforamulus hydrothermalis]CCO07019.1 Type I phosphodiesterase/nucleotide pyrophosphatase [Desulforamulus hydrothermalis Lam5 = DSM 18033]SHG97452.1 Type I phosphodiesterase / nucleotide pyrophosphatase [Desulforamulus hydrothermalis Lam5 = DSM 18033]
MYGQRLLYCITVFLIFFITASPVRANPVTNNPAVPEKLDAPRVTSKIFLIIVDGLQAATLQKTSAPNINGMANAGVRAAEVVTVFPDTSQATVASILTGMLPEQHKFIKSGSRPAGKTIQAIMEEKKINTAFFGVSDELKPLLARGGYHCSGPFNGKDELVINNLLHEWSQSQAYLNIVVLPELHGILDKYGADSNEYKTAVTRTDTHIGRLLKKLHDENSYENSMIIITGTLGAPPLIMKGLPFKESAVIPPVSLCDIAPTIGYLNGIKLENIAGLVLWNSFKEVGGQSEEYLLNERIKDLSLANAKLMQDMSRLQQEKLLVKQQQDIVAREKEDIQRQIEIRDGKIKALEKRISLYHAIALVLLALAAGGYVFLYKILRKRFLMF